MLKARFFGTPQISFGTDSEILTLTGRVQALFAYLCVTRQPQDRNKLADLLWDHQSDQEAKSNLRYVLRDLRKVIGDYLLVDGQMVAFNFDLPHWFDVTPFTTYLAPSMRTAPIRPELAILQELLNLYTGDFLAGFYVQDAMTFERWMLAQRRHFHDAMVYGLQLATEEHLALEDYEAGLALNQYLLTLEPWREEAHRQRMLLLAASGQRSAALMQYELCCQILEEELDAPPMNETTSLYTQIKSGLWFVERKGADNFNNQRIAIRAYPQTGTQHRTAVANSSTGKTAVNRQGAIDIGAMSAPSYLIGRRKELTALRSWLDNDRCRLAAILGLGGQGKSALVAWFVQEECARLRSAAANQAIAPLEQTDSQYVQDWPFPSSANQEDALLRKTPITQIVWRSLAQRPSCTELLRDLTQQLTNQAHQAHGEHPANFDQLVTLLFNALQSSRCLIVLDGVEAILSSTTPAAEATAAAYEQLFRLFVEREHQSCLLLTSRLRPAVLTQMQQQKELVHCLELGGLPAEESAEFLQAQGLATDAMGYRCLYEWYAGNPQILSQAADLIHELFDGDVAAFLQEEVHFLALIGESLAHQISELSPLAQQLLLVLAGAHQPLSRQALWTQRPAEPSKEAYYNALRELQRAHFVHQTGGQFTAATLPAAFLQEQPAIIK